MTQESVYGPNTPGVGGSDRSENQKNKNLEATTNEHEREQKKERQRQQTNFSIKQFFGWNQEIGR